MTRLRQYPLPEAAAVVAVALVLGSVARSLTRPRPPLPPVRAEVGVPSTPPPVQSPPGRWSDAGPSGYGLFEGLDEPSEGAGDQAAPDSDLGAGLRFVGVVGAPPDCTGLFAFADAPTVRCAAAGDALPELDLLVVALRAGEPDGGPIAVLRRLGDGRLFQLPLANKVGADGEVAR